MFESLYHHLAHALGITLPILVVLVLGALFRQRRWVDESFVESGNRLLFRVCMPALLFLATATRPVSAESDAPLAIFGVAATFVVVGLLWLVAPLIVGRERRGEFVQSSFRSNMGMIGIALCVSAYGEDVLARAGIFVAAMIVAYNVLSILVLTTHRSQVARNLLRNPLLIGILAGIAWQQLRIGALELALAPVDVFVQLALGRIAQHVWPLPDPGVAEPRQINAIYQKALDAAPGNSASAIRPARICRIR